MHRRRRWAAGFLAIRTVESLRSPRAPGGDAGTPRFFTITGVHWAHELAGRVILATLPVRGVWSGIDATGSPAFRVVSWSWHVVEAMWLVVLGTVYLWPRA